MLIELMSASENLYEDSFFNKHGKWSERLVFRFIM